MKMNNPFVTNGYAGPEYFCDREKETRQISELLVTSTTVFLLLRIFASFLALGSVGRCFAAAISSLSLHCAPNNS